MINEKIQNLLEYIVCGESYECFSPQKKNLNKQIVLYQEMLCYSGYKEVLDRVIPRYEESSACDFKRYATKKYNVIDVFLGEEHLFSFFKRKNTIQYNLQIGQGRSCKQLLDYLVRVAEAVRNQYMFVHSDAVYERSTKYAQCKNIQGWDIGYVEAIDGLEGFSEGLSTQSTYKNDSLTKVGSAAWYKEVIFLDTYNNKSKCVVVPHDLDEDRIPMDRRKVSDYLFTELYRFWTESGCHIVSKDDLYDREDNSYLPFRYSALLKACEGIKGYRGIQIDGVPLLTSSEKISEYAYKIYFQENFGFFIQGNSKEGKIKIDFMKGVEIPKWNHTQNRIDKIKEICELKGWEFIDEEVGLSSMPLKFHDDGRNVWLNSRRKNFQKFREGKLNEVGIAIFHSEY